MPRSFRAAVVGARLVAATVAIAAAYALCRPVLGRTGATKVAARRAARALQRLGPAFVKVGQLVSTRGDLLPPVVIEELSVLAESVRPLSPRRSRAALAAAYEGTAFPFIQVDYLPVAAGSIACVHRARLHDGTEVAVKLRRPGVAGAMAADLRVIKRCARLAATLPVLRGAPVVEMVDDVCAAVEAQLDFAREADNLGELRAGLTRLPRITVPAVHVDHCRPGCIVMDFLPGLTLDIPDRAGGDGPRQADATLHLLFEMMFTNGFVHCDLHPGNLYFTAGGGIVVLDAGFCVRLPDRVRREFAEFFYNFGTGDGERCAEVLIASVRYRAPDADEDGFRRRVAALIEDNRDLVAKDFSLVRFTATLFDLQRTHGMYAEAAFVFPLLSILVLEGTLRRMHPDLDFQTVATPYLLRAIARKVP